MQCHHFDAGRCRSCTLIPLPHAQQISAAQERIQALLAPSADVDTRWLPPIMSREAGFRAKAKMVVTGTAQEPRLGLLPPAPGEPGVDLVDCPLYPPAMQPLLEAVRALIRRAQIPPYNVARRRGELKHVLATISPDGEFLLRFVLRSERPLPRLREHLPTLLAAHPQVRVVTANLLPEHRAATEGPTEIHLAGAESLPVRTGDVTLHARPQSFLQTNTEVAAGLYRQAGQWVSEIAAERDWDAAERNSAVSGEGATPGESTASGAGATPGETISPLGIWDLYCGLGGFALHAALAAPSATITGVEVSEQAIAGAHEAAAQLPGGPRRPQLTFLADDATRWAIETAASPVGPPDVVIVNPPRRGIGPQLAGWLEESGVRDVIYSSCNPTTLAEDLAAMPSLRVLSVRYADMFPHTEHAEVIVRLARRR